LVGKETSISAVDPANEYEKLVDDVLGPEDSDSDGDFDARKKKKDKDRDDEGRGEEEKQPDYMEFDFRKGPKFWPENVELIDPKETDALLEKATLALEEAAKSKKKDKQDEEGKEKEKEKNAATESTSESKARSKNKTEKKVSRGPYNVPDAAVFETLKDGSTALIIPQGYRLKLNLNELLEGGDAKKEKRRKEEAKMQKRMEKYGASSTEYDSFGPEIGPSMMPGFGGGGGGFDKNVWDLDDDFGDWGKKFKQYVNQYTITLDMKIIDEPPREGIALFQTALIHSEENKRSGKVSRTK
jgi:hypothetical protein